MKPRIEPNLVAIVDCAGSFQCELNEWCKSCDDGYYERPGLLELDQFPRTPLGLTDALHGGRDLRETMRANAFDIVPALVDADLIAPAPRRIQHGERRSLAEGVGK